MKLDEICRVLEGIAPLHLAQSWDHVGLLAGDPQAEHTSISLAIDLTAAVLDEAIEHKHDLVLAYHPPLFKPISSLRADSTGTDAIIWKAIRSNIAVYSMHTALDAADGGTNDVIAAMCGVTEMQPFEYADDNRRECKIVVFVPAESADALADAMADAGAGIIGEYEKCSFRIPGTGTFQGSAQSAPAVGRAGQYETVDEIRLEMVTPHAKLPGVVQAIQQAHGYDEPAFDIYPLAPRPVRGIGRIGRLAKQTSPAELAALLRQQVATQAVQIVGDPAARIGRVAVCVGAAGSLPFGLGLGAADCLITGEIRHHDALAIERMGFHAIALGHWVSERPVLAKLAETLRERLPDVPITVSEADRDPFQISD